MEIRPAAPADRDVTVALLVAQMREHEIPTPAARLAAAFDHVVADAARGAILLAWEGSNAIGVAALSYAFPIELGECIAWLEELYVEPAARERGVGAALLRAALDIAEAAGAVTVELEIVAGHERVERLYTRFGFARLPRARWSRRTPGR
ncbi:MAG TPA: GNAT family N-acetyltransferase [Polyangia bacterium]|jgi:GNAT superfamily N-acetyltransferase|nr:GNAT family N-acetyltransferase [Polyangia bacterium]